MAKFMDGKNYVVLQGGDTNVKPVGDFLLKAEVKGEGSVASDGTLTVTKALPSIYAQQIHIGFADFDEAATSVVFDTPITIPKGAIVLRTLIDNVTKFEGGTVSAATLTLGDSDGSGGTTDPDRYNTGTPNVFADADVLDAGAVSGTALHTADAVVSATLDLTGGNGDDLTAGAATITIFYYLAADHSA